MGTVALLGGTVIDVVNERCLPDQVVVIEDGLIADVRSSRLADIPAGADRRTVKGSWILPGLVDMHAHLTPLSYDIPLELFLANGVTTVRDPGGCSAEQRVLREAVNEGNRAGPRILASGEILDGNPPVSVTRRIIVDTPGRGAAAVRHLAAQGMDCIKVYNNVTEDVLAVIIAVAAEYGLPVIGHVPRQLSMRRAVEMGLTGLEHIRVTGGDFLPAGQAQELDGLLYPEREARLWEMIDLRAPWVDDLIAVLVSHGATLDPTLIIDEVINGKGMDAEQAHPDNACLLPAVAEMWAAWQVPAALILPDHLRELGYQGVRKRREFVGRCAQAGVRIVAGTDGGVALGRLLPGFSLHHEIALLREAGLSAYQSLRAATIDAAHALGLARQIGSIEVGKTADIAVWTADPLTSPLRPADLALVITAGVCHDRDTLART